SIAIIGAGPAGLTLARLLSLIKPAPSLTIFERDASPSARFEQGGTLDLGAETGQAALRKCGLWETFLKYARYDGEELIFADKNWTELVHLGGGAGKSRDRPEIDRETLKGMLLESVPRECVRWGRKLREVGEDGSLRFDVEGSEEVEGPFDLVVGADGGWSRVRARLSDVKPRYSGVSGYEMEIKKPGERCPEVDKMVGKGSFFGSSDRKCLTAQRMGDQSLKTRSWYLCPEGETKETIERFGKRGTLDQMLRRYEGWAPEMVELYRQGDVERMKEYTLYELPVGSKWEHTKGFTLIGDAASLMTPFGGEGVNKAMKDSLELTELIEKSMALSEDLTLDEAVSRYEQAMFPRAEKIQALTLKSKEWLFSPEAP
ncbi:FAD/NAD(P)-binding domain-containing protein, partial [Lophium mytilinum]